MQNSVHLRLNLGSPNWRQPFRDSIRGSRSRVIGLIAISLMILASPIVATVLGIIIADPSSQLSTALAGIALASVISIEAIWIKQIFRIAVRRFAAEVVEQVSFVERDFLNTMANDLAWDGEELMYVGSARDNLGDEVTPDGENRDSGGYAPLWHTAHGSSKA